MNQINNIVSEKIKDIETNLSKALKSEGMPNINNEKALLTKVSEDISIVITILSQLLDVVMSEISSDKN